LPSGAAAISWANRQSACRMIVAGLPPHIPPLRYQDSPYKLWRGQRTPKPGSADTKKGWASLESKPSMRGKETYSETPENLAELEEGLLAGSFADRKYHLVRPLMLRVSV